MFRRLLCATAGAVGVLLLLADARFTGGVFRVTLAARVLWQGSPAELARLVPAIPGFLAAAALALCGGALLARALPRRRLAAALLGAAVLFSVFDPAVLAFVAERGRLSAPWYLDVGDLARAIGIGLLGLAFLLGVRGSAAGEPSGRGGAGLLPACLVAGVLPATLSGLALDGEPVTNDGRAQLFQAELFARGEVARDVGELSDFFPARQVVPGPRAFSKYPPGYAAALVPGVMVGAPGLLPRLLAMLVPLLVFRIARRLGSPLPLLAAWLSALSPAVLGVGCLWLSHSVTTPFCLLFADLVLADREEREQGRRARARLLAAGAAISIVFLTRPVTALAFALPFVPVLGLAATALVVVAALPGIALFLGLNGALTGSPLKTAYGYYADRVSPNDRFGLVNLPTALSYSRFNLTRLASWAHGGAGALLLSVVGGLGRPRRAWVLVAPIVCLLLAHALHRFHGIPWVGPLYLVEGIPPLCILAAGGLGVVARERGRLAATALVVLLAIGGAQLLGRHLAVARGEMLERTAPARAAQEAGVERGVVFVPVRTEDERKRHSLPPPALGVEQLVFARDLGPRNVVLLERLGSPDAWRWDPEADVLVALASDGVSAAE